MIMSEYQENYVQYWVWKHRRKNSKKKNCFLAETQYKFDIHVSSPIYIYLIDFL